MIRDFRAAEPVDARTPVQVRADYDNPMAEYRRETDAKLAGLCRWCREPLGEVETVLDGNPPNMRPVHKACFDASVRVAHRPTVSR